MKTYLRSVLIVVPLALAACAQTEPPRPLIRGEPIYSKYGDVIGCEQGRYIPGAVSYTHLTQPTKRIV